MRVYSEFRRVDPFGQIVAADRGGRPREILSPMVARNAFTSYHVAVTLKQPGEYKLDIGQNPENTFRATLYKEVFHKHGQGWIPDGLEPVRLPYAGRMPDPAASIPDQTTTVFWLDLWAGADTVMDRIKVEPQLWAGGRWNIYPMEVRVISARVPRLRARSVRMGNPAAPADSAADIPLRARLCGSPEPAGAEENSVRARIQRNVWQDLALAAARDANGKLLRAALAQARSHSVERWCASPASPSPQGPEWYLRLRDFLLRHQTDPSEL